MAGDAAPPAQADGADDAPVEYGEYNGSEAQNGDDSASYATDYGNAGRDYRDDDAEDIGHWTPMPLDLRDHLRHELCGYRLTERDRLLAEALVEALDDDGYLRQAFEDIAGALELTPSPTDEEWMVALRIVQQLDAPGLGARDLAECLRLQLDALDDDLEGVALARTLASNHLDLLARRETAELRRRLGCGDDAIHAACRLIRGLDPKPGIQFARPHTDHVVPDVIVRKVKGKWVVTTNPAVMPRARLHRTYAALFRRARCDDRAPLAQELQEARWLIRNVEQRFTTIQRVAESIVANQRTFFDYGEIAMKPLVLRKVAEELNLHESTISRATGNKYMATPRGVFEFKHFFSRELATETGGKCSAAAVRALLKDMISAEDRGDPLSDVSLTRMLADQGVVVARRTVTKYRGLMKVPPAELRRQTGA